MCHDPPLIATFAKASDFVEASMDGSAGMPNVVYRLSAIAFSDGRNDDEKDEAIQAKTAQLQSPHTRTVA